MSRRVRLLVLAGALGVIAVAAPRAADAKSMCADKCDRAMSNCLLGGGGSICQAHYDSCINTC